MSQVTMKLEPIYGYGWSAIGGSGSRETPAPFSIRVIQSADGVWSGIVETAGHEFEGRTVRLSKRHEESDGIVNVEVDQTASGWATLT